MSDRFYQYEDAFLDQTVRLYYCRIGVVGREGTRPLVSPPAASKSMIAFERGRG